MGKLGPTLRVAEMTCRGCEKLRSEYYCVEDGNDCDSGYDHHCDAAGGQAIPGSSAKTPDWCPHRSSDRDIDIDDGC